MKTFSLFFQFLWRYKYLFIVFVFILLFQSISSAIQPYFYKLIVNNLVSADYWLLVRILLLYVGVRIFENLISVATYYLGDRILIPASRDARVKVFAQVQDLDFAYHTEKNTGSLISAFKRGDNAFFETFHNFIDLFRIGITFIVMFLFFVDVDWWVTLPLLFVLIVNVFLIRCLILVNMTRRKEFNNAEDEISAIITDNLINFETVKFFAKEVWERLRLKKSFDNWSDKLWRFSNSFRLMDISLGTVSNFGVGMILFIALQRLVTGKIDSGDFVLVLGFIAGFFPRLFDMFFNLRSLATRHVDLRRYFQVLEESVLVEDPKSPVRPVSIRGKIVFDDVDFSYPGGKEGAIADLGLTIKPGETVAFVGSSGAGKSTIVKLLLRFYDVDRGRILIDDVDIKRFTKSDLRSFIGIVPQEPVLFNDIIAYNIGYGLDCLNQKKIAAAAKMANLSDFIELLPEKYQTMVGERGVKLSGGQKQRLAIARMILTNPQIIVFDEATSQLDSESEKLIQESFWRAKKNKTAIIIAHRLSTVRRADRIVVLSDGRVVEVGNHQNLLRQKKGIYRRLWRLQTRVDKN
ncbi:MAG: ABC transporter ATP-binding protein [Candidatus Shapirobacteria bacterium]|nr:ABC transporter ATP-binding protein [Candidatus Shapirobacteria bacterium]